MNYYNWYAGNHCYPKCSNEKVLKCRKKIEEAVQKCKINSHKEFVSLVRNELKICDLSATEYIRNVYKEPLCHHSNHMKINQMDEKEKQIFQKIQELTLILMWMARFSDQKIDNQPIWRAWKGYDFKVLDSLLENQYVTFSYKSKSILLMDKGINKAKELIHKYQLEK